MLSSYIFSVLFLSVQRGIPPFQVLFAHMHLQVYVCKFQFRPLAPLFSLNWSYMSITITIIQRLQVPSPSSFLKMRRELHSHHLPLTHLSLITWDPAPQARPRVVMETTPHASVGLNDMV